MSRLLMTSFEYIKKSLRANELRRLHSKQLLSKDEEKELAGLEVELASAEAEPHRTKKPLGVAYAYH